MKFSDAIRDNVNKKKSNKDVKGEVRNEFNQVTLKLIKRFIEDVETGTVAVTDIADVMRLYNMYLSVNEIGEGEDGTGRLPELPRKQRQFLEGKVLSLDEGHSEEEEEYIDETTFEDMTTEEVEKLLIQREEELNSFNEGEY